MRPADQVERWPIDRLIPYAKNTRTHFEAQIAQLAASLKEWGWTNQVLADASGRPRIRCRGRATCGCAGSIVSSAATALSRRTSSACSAASSVGDRERRIAAHIVHAQLSLPRARIMRARDRREVEANLVEPRHS